MPVLKSVLELEATKIEYDYIEINKGHIAYSKNGHKIIIICPSHKDYKTLYEQAEDFLWDYKEAYADKYAKY